MEELIDLRHMEPVFDIPDTSFYMPHHPVIKENSTTTKPRVVFNASARSSTGYSLNDALMIGPQLQPELFTLLLRFRIHKYAMTADIAKMYRQVYVTKDDLLTGASNKNVLIKLQKDISQILLSGGFELRKWATNCPQLRSNLPNVSENDSHPLVDKQEVRTLGLIWNTSKDNFTFKTNINERLPCLTKSTLLSDATKLFEPLGFISPCTVKSKMWLQQIWRTNVDWDEAVPPEIADPWLKHRLDLVNLNKLKLTRGLGTDHDCSTTEFHAFSDASELAYAAVVYSRTINKTGAVTVALVAARTKVAPLKSTTLPRLELCAAHVAAKLIKQIISSLGSTSYPLFAWTKSTITLAWLQGHPSRWSTFVANRVAEIQEVLPPECWSHVRSEHNPADCASRGVSSSELLKIQLWWQGPQWLKSIQSTRKESAAKSLHTTAKTKATVVHVTQTDIYWELISRYSSYSKLKRITAYILRFIHNSRCKSKGALKNGLLNADDIENDELALIRYDQSHAFSKEILNCAKGRQIPLRSSIIRLQPFLDKNGVLRVGGRLKNANVTIETKHPIILSKGSPLAKLMAAEIHPSTPCRT